MTNKHMNIIGAAALMLLFCITGCNKESMAKTPQSQPTHAGAPTTQPTTQPASCPTSAPKCSPTSQPSPTPATKKPIMTEPQDITFTASCDATPQRYVQMLPKGFNSDKPHDILIALHGHDSNRWQFVRDKRSECRAARDTAAKHNMIYISPDYRASTSWMGPAAESDMVDIIKRLRKEHKVNRVFLCGASMGGASCLTFTALHPKLIAGVASMNGVANHLEYAKFQKAIAQSFGGSKTKKPAEYRKRSAEFHVKKFTMPLGLTTGGKDTATPPASVIRLAKAAKKSNPAVLHIHRKKTGHSTSYKDACTILEFVIKKAKTPISKK